MEPNEQPEKGFVHKTLPWLIAAVALVFYLVTLNRWVTLGSLPVVAKVAGWDWSTIHFNPLLYVLTYPFRFLPGAWQPVALNLLAALCAALTLACLARSVALLPHDRTREQRQREHSEMSLLSLRAAWMPPVFAVLVCGLQLSFWEHATALTGALIDLLLFAYVILCLLEYRLDEKEGRLYRMALAYGLAVTNSWAMIGFFPAFLIALVWIRGTRFFEPRFIMRMVLWGLAGLLPYFLIPAVTVASDQSMLGFWDLLRTYWSSQRSALLGFPKSIFLICALTSLLPVLIIGIRWPSTFGDTSVAGAVLTNFMFHLVHAVFLAACLWVAFDPPFSPRALSPGAPLLSFYYLGALCVGYFTGYFLLVFGPEPSGKSWRRPSAWRRALNPVITALIWLALLAMPAGLVRKNLPSIRAANSPVLHQFAASSAASLPKGGALVLSDDTLHLLLIEAVLSEQGRRHPHLLLDTIWLPYHLYQRQLWRRYPLWPDAERYLENLSDPIPSSQIVQFIDGMNQNTNQPLPVFYLHPAFNLYIERFYQVPRGLVYELQVYPTNAVNPLPPTPAEIEENQAFWARANRDVFPQLLPLVEQSAQVGEVVGRYYSRALNYWGVRLQRHQRIEEARAHFVTAKQLNPDNLAAIVNLEFNQHLQSGRGGSVKFEKSVEEKMGQYRRWDSLLQLCGPVDEPNFCFNLGQVFARGPEPLRRQAAQQFSRARELNPDNIEAALWLANTFLKARLADQVLAVIRELRAQKTVSLSSAQQIELITLEAWAHAAKNDYRAAERLLEESGRRYPQSSEILETLAEIHLQAGRFTNALAVVEKQLASAPDNVELLINKSAIHITLQQYDQALPPLNRALELDPKNNVARLNRAISLRLSGKYDAALRDYEELKKIMPREPKVYFGLAEIARHQRNKTEAIANYERFLKLTAPTSEDALHAKAQLEGLKSGGASLPPEPDGSSDP